MRFLLYTLALILVVSVIILIFIFNSIRRNVKWFGNPPSEGKFVDNHGKRIYYRVRGKGEPVVVVLSAIGSSQAEWWPIQNEVGIKFRMITMDRAGYGWSSAKEDSRSAACVAEDLDAILKFERVKKPVYLVAHSTGTIYARYYAAAHPQNVQGALFIDPIPLNFQQWINSMNEIEECHHPFDMPEKRKLKASKGFFRVFSPFKGYRLDRRYKRYIIEHYTKTENYEIMKKEFSQIENSLAAIEAEGKFPSVPLRVLYPANESLIRDWIRSGTPEYSARQLGRLHQELSRDILQLSPKTTILEVEGSGEFIHLSKPDIVAKEILELMRE